MPFGRTQLISALERRLLQELAKGAPSKMLAQQLGLSEASLHRHTKALCRKLRLTGRAEAVEWAAKNGFQDSTARSN